MGVRKQLSAALRPGTNKCYNMLFSSFVAFCVCANLNIFQLNQMHILSYIEYLVMHGVSAHTLANPISACKAKFTMHGLQFHLWDHPNVRYLLSLLGLTDPL